MEATEQRQSVEVVYKIVGVCYENRQEILSEFYKKFEYGKEYPVFLRPEEDNPYDQNAVGVWMVVGDAERQIGYVPRDSNVELKRLLPRLEKCVLNSIGISPKSIIGVSVKCVFRPGEE